MTMDAVDIAAQHLQEISGRYPNCPVEVLDDGALLWRVAPETRVKFEARVGWREGVLVECTPTGTCSIRVGDNIVISVKWQHLRMIPGAGKVRKPAAPVQPKPLAAQLRQRARQLVGAGYETEFVKPLVDAAALLDARRPAASSGPETADGRY